MSKNSNDIWELRFNASIERIKQLNTWLIVLNLTVVFTFVQQFIGLNEQKNQLRKDAVFLNQPWEDLRPLYENTFGFLEGYTQEHVTPWYQLCLFGSLEMTKKINEHLSTGEKNNPTITRTIHQIDYAGNVLSFYNSDLRNVISAQKVLKSFDELDNQQLKSLINVFTFENRIDQDSFKKGIKSANESAILLLYISDQLKKEGNTPNISIREEKYLSFAEKEPDFNAISTEMLLQDMRTFGDSMIKIEKLNALKNYLDSNNFTTLKIMRANYSKLNEKINEMENGQFFQIPLLNASISLIQFVILGGIINLFIIFYLFSNVSRTKYYQSKNKDFSNEFIDAVYDNWTLGIRNLGVFITVYTFFCCLISLISLITGILIFKLSEKELFLTICIAVINIIIAATMSIRYYKLPITKHTLLN